MAEQFTQTEDLEIQNDTLTRAESQEEFSITLRGSAYMDITFKIEEEDDQVPEKELSPQSDIPERYKSFISLDDARFHGIEIDKRNSLEFERGESEPGIPRPRVIWRPDNSSTFCVGCHRLFTFFLRKHHCRGCGNLYCDACSGWQTLLPSSFALVHQDNILSAEERIPQRVCKGCHEILLNGGKVTERLALSSKPKESKNIFIIAIGGNGKVRPYVSLGKSLQARGHHVCIGSDASNEELITKNGISFILIPGNIFDTLKKAQTENEFTNRKSLLFSSNPAFDSVVSDHIGTWQTCIYDTIESHDFDVVVLNAVSVFVSITTLEYKATIPFVVSWLSPSIPTKYYAPPSSGESDSWFQFVNQIKWRVFHSISWNEYKNKVNEQRETLGLRKFSNENIFQVLHDMQVPCMNNWSPTLFNQPPDWTDNIEITGQLILEDDDYQPPSELMSFLKGSAPVYIGFGNISPDLSAEDIVECFKCCFCALEKSKSRGIVCCSKELALQLTPLVENMHEEVFFTEFVPHQWLFPQCKVVIIHGGVGTTMTALRQGIIPIILPATRDQSFWGDLLARKGYAPQIQDMVKCTVEHLAEVMNIASTDEEMWERVQSVSRRMKREQGNERAVEFIERKMNFQPKWPSYLIPN